MVVKRLLLVLAIALSLRGADQFEALRASIRKQVADSGVPSLAIAVARDGRILWEEGFGWADREKQVAATPQTMYSLASISKPITATGLMVLVEAGKIDLDRPVNDYLGGAKLRARAGDAAQATVRRVANHSAGLPLHYQFFYSDEPYRRPPMDETIRRYGNLITPPGEKYQYSNLGYGVLDYVISRTARKSYADFMREEVFSKLGLTRMSVHLPPGFEKFEALRYGPDGSAIPFYDFDHDGGSAVYASAHDLVRFAMFHLKARLPDQKAILSDASIDAMQRPAMKSGPRSSYGIGWAVIDGEDGYRVVSHTGGMGGVSTSLWLIPSEKLAVVALCNANSMLPHRVSSEIMAKMLPRMQTPGSASSETSGVARVPAKMAGAWAGKLHTYKQEIPLLLEVLESGQVEAQLGDQARTRVNDLRWRDETLTGRMNGDIGTEDANRRPYFLSLSLTLRGGTLSGAATAISLPGKRTGNALAQWVELRKQ